VTRRCFGGRLGGAVRVAAILAACFSLTDCGNSDRYAERARYRDSDDIPRGGGRYAVGKPYMIAGRLYFPAEDPNYRADGIASWYGRDFHGGRTANGEIYNMHALTAAHPTLPLGSRVLVTNVKNGRSVEVLINDRGPIIPGRIIDLSYAAAQKLDAVGDGTFQVRVRMLRAGQAGEGARDRQRNAAND
jgi:rare lipoprotein A